MTLDKESEAGRRAYDQACSAVDSLLSVIGGQHGRELRLDEIGSCAFSLGDNVPVIVSVAEGSDRVVIYGPIAPLPDDMDDRYAIFRSALQRNFVEPALGGGLIGLDPDGGTLVFVLGSEIDGLDAVELGGQLDSVYAAVMEIREALEFDPDEQRIDAAMKDAPVVIHP